MKRVNVIGPPGAGKTFVSDAINRAYGLPMVGLDAFRHGPNWSEVPETLFEERIAAAVAEEHWVIDGSYPSVRPLIWQRADTVVWIDLSRRDVMRRLVWRSFRDWVSGREPVPGNRERLRHFIRPWHPMRWARNNHAEFRKREEAWLKDPRWSHIAIVHLRSKAEIASFLDALSQPTR